MQLISLPCLSFWRGETYFRNKATEMSLVNVKNHFAGSSPQASSPANRVQDLDKEKKYYWSMPNKNCFQRRQSPYSKYEWV
jgi:hypothetical protein